MNGINPAVTNAVISVESKGNPFALGRHGDSGLMQIRHKYVPESQSQLFQSCTNVMRGTALLKQAREKCKHTVDNTFVVCYNLGTTGGSRLRFPKKWNYYVKVTREMK